MSSKTILTAIDILLYISLLPLVDINDLLYIHKYDKTNSISNYWY